MDFLEKQCPVCSMKFQKDDDIVVCPKCGAPYHRDCYDKNGKCIFPDLHRSKKSWSEVYDTSKPDDKDKKEEAVNFVTCPVCGEKNPKDNAVCQNCGAALPEQNEESPHYKDPYEQLRDFMRKDPDEDEIDDFYKELNSSDNRNPSIFFIDPMGGVAKDEDFDGVTGAEMAKFVRANTPYYMPVFKRIKSENKGKFNFAAFFLTGGWYLYRKQYVIGTVISVLYFLLTLARYLVVTWFAADLWSEVYSAVSSSGVSYLSYKDVFSWAFSHNSSDELFLMMMPYMISVLTFILQLVCGFAANRGYYKHCVHKISEIKKSGGENTVKAISEKGGVNTPLAWSMMVCYLIATFAFSLL